MRRDEMGVVQLPRLQRSCASLMQSRGSRFEARPVGGGAFPVTWDCTRRYQSRHGLSSASCRKHHFRIESGTSWDIATSPGQGETRRGWAGDFELRSGARGAGAVMFRRKKELLRGRALVGAMTRRA